MLRTILNYCFVIMFFMAGLVWVFISTVFGVLVDFEEVWQEIIRIERTKRLWLDFVVVVAMIRLIFWVLVETLAEQQLLSAIFQPFEVLHPQNLNNHHQV